MTACQRCDEIGPRPPFTQAALDLHRAWHDCYRPLERLSVDKIIDPLSRRINRTLDATP